MTNALLKLCVPILAILAFTAAPAFAYYETKPATGSSSVSTSTPDPDGRSCPDCHGLDAGVTAPGVTQTRKGPHGGYTPGTQKCQTCHVLHDSAGNLALLPQQSISATCNTCHDGTGGGGVYGVIQYRSGVAPSAQHRIDAASLNATGLVTVPGGAANGGAIETTFTGESGGLTCTDCHSPHDSNTVNAFKGDRKRSVADTRTAQPTNRLLRKRPTKGSVSVSEYGSDWCQSCHSGRHASADTSNHPVATNTDGFYYRKVNVLAGYDTTAVSAVSTDLGGSNLGYIMPEPHGSGNRNQPAPICQQCHEDSRAIGNVATFTVNSAAESFTVNTDGVGGGNPRFQNFPHEAQNADFLVETRDSLCLNCHTP